MASIIKVDDVQDAAGNNIIREAGDTITIGASGDTISIPSGATIANSGTATGFGGSGRILQVETINVDATTTVNSTSLVDTSLTDTITPAATGSKILLMYGWESKLNNEEGYGTAIKRAISGGSTTVVAEQEQYNYWLQGASGIELRWFPMICYVDSPSTTSEITYTIQVKGNNTNTIEWVAKRMILMEIGA
jgi:hypothetical protein